MPASCGNLWLRPDGASPWEYDDICYLRPEVQLLHKAPGLREKDQADFDACLDLLEPGRREWLRTALGIAHPGHPWLGVL